MYCQKCNALMPPIALYCGKCAAPMPKIQPRNRENTNDNSPLVPGKRSGRLPFMAVIVGILAVTILILLFFFPELLGTLIAYLIVGAIIILLLREAYWWVLIKVYESRESGLLSLMGKDPEPEKIRYNSPQPTSHSNPIVGRWVFNQVGIMMSWTYNANGTFEHKCVDTKGEVPNINLSGTYHLDGNKLLAIDRSAGPQAYIITYLNDMELTINDFDNYQRTGTKGLTYKRIS